MKNELLSIANDYINKNNLKKYIKDIVFTNDNNKIIPYVAGYNFESKIIQYNLEKALKENNYINIIYFMYHELVHVKQNKILNNLIPSIEKTLLRYDEQVFKKYYYYYIENYEKFLSEYNATIEGKINTMEYTKENILNEIYDNILYYYPHNNRSLLYDFYNDLNALNIYEKINEKCKYDDSKRLLLGLNINKETHNKIIIKDKNYYNEIKRLI